MILTVTPNPSLDLLFTADDPLRWDDANRVDAPRRRAGGQGINVSRAVGTLGGTGRAIALLGGRVGDELMAMLSAESTPFTAVPITGDTRTFVAVRESSTGRSLLVNPRGPACDPADGERLLDAVRAALLATPFTWVVSSGSTPPGLPVELHAYVGSLAHEARVRFVADCDGEALAAATRAGVCDLLVPNLHEAGRLAGINIDGIAAAGRAANRLREHAPIVAIKLGEAGAVLATEAGTWHARPPVLTAGSAVGAGDAFLAALLLALDAELPPDATLRSAVTAGTATLRSHGGALLDAADLSEVGPAVEVVRLET